MRLILLQGLVKKMNKLIDQMLELYFLGGNLREILQAGKEVLRPKQYNQVLLNEMFKGW